jgi:hypothetical protein
MAQDHLFTFGVSYNLGLGMGHAQLYQLFLRKGLMDNTASLPENQIPPCLLHYIAPQILVRSKNNRLVFRDLLNNLHGVRTGANDVAHRLDFCRAVNVRHHNMIWVLSLKVGEGFRRATVGQGTARCQVR